MLKQNTIIQDLEKELNEINDELSSLYLYTPLNKEKISQLKQQQEVILNSINGVKDV